VAILLVSGCHGLFLRPQLGDGARVVETPRLSIRTDVSEESAALLAAAGEAMLAELEGVLATPDGTADGPRREVVVFRQQDGFKRFLRSHLFANDRAIGFFCEMGGECALAWHDPPGPEDLRVLRHELAHQHLAQHLRSRIPTWLEEGLVERLALGPLAGGPVDPGAQRGGGEPAPATDGAVWRAYLRQRHAADSVTAALAVHGSDGSWPDADEVPVTDVPEPRWADEERGYVLHLLFVRFLEAHGEGLDGAIGQMLLRAARGEAPRLDLSHRFGSLGEMERRFEDFVLHEGLQALLEEQALTDDAAVADPAIRRVALETLATTSSPRD
jgi:hypothetical protein